MRLAVPVTLVLALAAVTGWAVLAFDTFERVRGQFFTRSDSIPMLLCLTACWLLFAGAIVALRRTPERIVPWVVLGGTLLIGIAALLGGPNTSTDSARYAWDGIVQKAGISPYAHVPVDPALADLRPSWLFPDPIPTADGTAACRGERIGATTELGTGQPLCTALNRPTVPTIYPPLAELWFLLVRAAVPATAGFLPFQVAGLVVVLAVTAMLLRALRARALDPRWAALWGWCPLVASEGITNSHVDVLGAALALAAVLLVSRRRRVWGGIALGAAIATKLIPVIVAPAMLRRRPLPLVVASAATFAVLYVPYVLSTGIGVLGYLPGYLSEEGYESGTRFVLIPPIVPGPAAAFVVAAVLAILAGLVLGRTDPDTPWVGQTVMVGATLLAVSPRYPWYGLLLVPFVAMSGRAEWFAVPLALTTRLFAPPLWTFPIALLLALIVVLVGSWLRLPPHRRLPWHRSQTPPLAAT